MRVSLTLTLGFALLAGCGGSAEPNSGATRADCELQAPIVLSHHWSMREICPSSDVIFPVDPEDCERRERAKNCVEWIDGETAGDQDCAEWRVPEEERALPPRDYNVHDSTLVRDVSTYHRYFSAEIVKRLEECGNDVYVADKPAFASHAVRARSLRNTVLLALEETGAGKVVIIGHSQGVQDARYLVAALPVDDNQPAGDAMRDKVAAVVSLAGEDQGAGSSELLLNNGLTYGDRDTAAEWGAFGSDPAGWTETAANEVLWRDATRTEPTFVLLEGYRPEEYGLDTVGKYRHYMHSIAVLSKRYMQGATYPDAQPGSSVGGMTDTRWDGLRTFVGMIETAWDDVVAGERDNGVAYYSYGAEVQSWNEEDWGSDLVFRLLSADFGTNDGYVSVESQRLDARGYPNFRHDHTLQGATEGRGYHHMFFTGRNDTTLAPATDARDAAPYDGGSPDLFEQVLRNLVRDGF